MYLWKGSELKEGKEPPGLYQLGEAGAQLAESLQPRGRSIKSTKTARHSFQIITLDLTSQDGLHTSTAFLLEVQGVMIFISDYLCSGDRKGWPPSFSCSSHLSSWPMATRSRGQTAGDQSFSLAAIWNWPILAQFIQEDKIAVGRHLMFLQAERFEPPSDALYLRGYRRPILNHPQQGPPQPQLTYHCIHKHNQDKYP